MINIKKYFIRFRKILTEKRGSPMVEEGILIGIGLFGLILILSVVTGILDWFVNLGDELIRELSSM